MLVIMNNNPVGVIDSGFGGLSVLRHLIKDLPQETFIYFADSAFCPYGRKTFDEIQKRMVSIVDFLIREHRVKLIVVACNTATAAAIDALREKYNLPFVGMEPAIKPAALSTKSKVVGVLATEGTFNGRLFKQTCEKFASDVKVIIRAGNGLVELIEKGKISGEEIECLLQEYIAPMERENADLLVLGCTHFPFLQGTLEKLFPKIQIIDPAPAVSKQTLNLLHFKNLVSDTKSNENQYYTSGCSDEFDAFLLEMLKIYKKSRHIDL
jgi:glutamate racemase